MKGMRLLLYWNELLVLWKKTKQPFEVALAATRIGNLFTTHTAVSAGFDRFSPDLIAKYLGKYAQTKLGISLDSCLPWAG